MFRTPPYLEKTTYIRVDLDTALTFPGNEQTQKKSGYKFTSKDRDNFYDWYNGYFRVDFDLEATVNGANIDENTRSAPINGSFSLIKNLIVRSSGKNYTRRIIFTRLFSSKTCLTFRMIFREVWKKTIFGILTMLMTLWLQNHCEEPWNAGKGDSIRPRQNSSYHYPFEQILLLRKSFRQADATNTF